MVAQKILTRILHNTCKMIAALFKSGVVEIMKLILPLQNINKIPVLMNSFFHENDIKRIIYQLNLLIKLAMVIHGILFCYLVIVYCR